MSEQVPSEAELRTLTEAIDRLAAYDDDTPVEDLRGNLDAIREQCKRILTPPPAAGAAAVPRRRFVVRTNCEYAIVIETTSAEAALKEAETLDFDKHWDKSWSEFEAEEDLV